MKTSSKVLTAVFVILLSAFVCLSILNYNGFFYDKIERISKTPYLSTYTPEDKYVRPVGRTVFENGIRWCSYSGSGIEFDCLGESVDVTLLSDTQSQPYSHKPRVAITVNDEFVFDETLSTNEQQIHISLSEYTGSVIVRIIKQSESMFSSFGIGEISVMEKRAIRPTHDKAVKIEFIGDSITAGYGIDEENYHASFSTATENFTKTYAYQTAKALDAQYSAVAFSGYGVLSGATSGGRLNSDATIFKFYDKAITNKKFENDENLYIWDNSKFNPDIVVINLGTNDASYCSTAVRRSAFCDKYVELLETVRQSNPDAFILCVLGDVNNSLFSSIETAIDTFKQSTGDTRLASSIIRYDMRNTGAVIDGHPTQQGHQLAAQDLTQIIKTIIETGTYYETETETQGEAYIN